MSLDRVWWRKKNFGKSNTHVILGPDNSFYIWHTDRSLLTYQQTNYTDTETKHIICRLHYAPQNQLYTLYIHSSYCPWIPAILSNLYMNIQQQARAKIKGASKKSVKKASLYIRQTLPNELFKGRFGSKARY